MCDVLSALGAELGKLQTIRRVTTVLLGDVVPLLALGACERDLRTDVRCLLGHFYSRRLMVFRSGNGTRTRDTTIMSRLLYRLSYPAVEKNPVGFSSMGGPRAFNSGLIRAPMRNRTADLLLTMETLYRLSYRG